MEDNYLEDSIDLFKIFSKIKELFATCIVICCITSTAAFAYSSLLIEPSYTSTGKMIVVQNGDSTTNNQLNINDVNLSQKLVNTYSEILKSEKISDIVFAKLELPYSNKEFNQIVKISGANNTEVINISATTGDPQESTMIVNTIIEVFQEEIYSIMRIENVSILNWAKVPTAKSSPSILQNTIIGLLLGIIISGLLVILAVVFDNKIKTEEELKEIMGISVIGVIPDFDIDNNNGGNKYE